MTSQASHYSDVIMGLMASQITSFMIVYLTVIQAQIKENIKVPHHWPLCRRIHWWLVNSPHKWPVTRKMFPFDDVIKMASQIMSQLTNQQLVHAYIKEKIQGLTLLTLCEGNPSLISKLSSQRTPNGKSISISWCLYVRILLSIWWVF